MGMRGSISAAGLLAVLFCAGAYAQQAGRGNPAPSPKAAAPADFTGYWVSIVSTEDQWLLRMNSPGKGIYPGIFLTPEGRKLADSWDPAKDEAAGDACKAYGAPAIMMVPGHLHVTWENDSTLRIDADAGTQTRIFHFGGPAPQSGDPQLQGYSIARWDSQGGRGTEAGEALYRKTGNALKVVTTHMRPGYLYKNGIPYSGNAVLTEYFNRIVEPNGGPNGEPWLIVMTVLEDPQYLAESFIRTLYFKKLPDGSRWSPSPCSVR
jgi:hypothetical protein